MDVNFLRLATIDGGISTLFPIPLANIVESGNNYIRFSNGTQICYGKAEIMTIKNSHYMYGVFNYAKSFVNDDNVHLAAIHSCNISDTTMNDILSNHTNDQDYWSWNAYVESCFTTKTRGMVRYYSNNIGDGITSMTAIYILLLVVGNK